jgi:hypothetical protein
MARHTKQIGSLVLALVAVSLSGCFLDEIDKSVNANKSKAAATAADPKAAGEGKTKVASAQPAKAGAPAGPAAPSWWESAKTLGSEESAADIVGCGINARVEFMTREDCQARGGSIP